MTKLQRHNKSCKCNSSPPKNSIPLDTLAQLATLPENGANDPDFSLSSCISIQNKKSLQKRARRKYMSTGLSLRLVDAAKQNSRSVLKKSYFNTFHCAKTAIVYTDGKVKSAYCKNRWCMVCNSIRTAKLINRYKPLLDEWDDKYFVTLTIPNVSALDLRNAIEAMQYTFNRIRKRMGKRNDRGEKMKLVGLRKLECTYNARRNDYHPHFHLIVRGEEMAKEIIKIWLNTYKTASPDAQDVRPADNKSCLEMFKYFTKVITKSAKGENKIYADAMDEIFNAMKRKRVFQPFGFKASAELGEAATDVTKEEFARVYNWYQEVANWVDEDTGELLTQYKPADGMKELIKNITVRKSFSLISKCKPRGKPKGAP